MFKVSFEKNILKISPTTQKSMKVLQWIIRSWKEYVRFDHDYDQTTNIHTITSRTEINNKTMQLILNNLNEPEHEVQILDDEDRKLVVKLSNEIENVTINVNPGNILVQGLPFKIKNHNQ